MNRLIICALLLVGSVTTNVGAADITAYPAWSLNDAEGQATHFPDDVRKPTLILFWASWCPYCNALMPHLQSVIDEYGESSIDVWAVNVFEKDGVDPQAHLKERAFQFRLITDADEVAKSWNVHATPGLFLVNDRGEITWHLGMTQQMRGDDGARVKHWQIAARKAPYWAAEMRKALRKL